MNQEIIEKLLTAGKIAAQVRRETAAKLSISGMPYLEAMDFAEQRILKLGGQIAWAQMAVNETAAHFCPEEDEQGSTTEGDLIKVDIGVHLDGYIADNAMTIEVGTSNRYQDLIKAAQNALKASIKLVRPGCQLWELGEAQLSEAEALGFTTIKNLSGHTIERYKVHAGISIPSYNTNNKTELQEGWQIAIEPFVTTGVGKIHDKGKATIFMLQKAAKTGSLYARRILPEIESRKELPFTTRWLSRKFGRGTTALALRDLLKSGALEQYPPLVEVSKGMVAQFEHSMIVKDKSIVYTRHEEDEW